MSKEVKHKELIIIGGGPAGLTAAIYATRAKLDMLLLEDQILGGQVRTSYSIENYPGFKQISGTELADLMQQQAEELGAEIDEFAQEASEFDTLDEYKADIKAKIQTRKEKEADAAKREAVITKIIENSEMDIPEAMVEQQKMQMLEDFEMRLRSQGLSIEQYMQFTGMTANKFMESMAPQALKDIQYRLVLEAIAAAEKIEVEDSELDAEYQSIADMYNMPLDKVMSVIGEEEIAGLKKDVAVRKAADLIVEAAVVK